jgi:bifunctional DNA-binding transcriptional regulator/antitoxin component of YhaV-PrlF toxin-antitoxin module
MIGVIPNTLGDKTLGEVTVDRLMHISVPADIAEKLGIEPKE